MPVEFFGVQHKGREFGGNCYVSFDEDGYIANVDIVLFCWYSKTNGKGYYHEVERADRNWLRINKLLVEVELKIKRQNLVLGD